METWVSRLAAPRGRVSRREGSLAAVCPGAGLFVALGTSTRLCGGEANARRNIIPSSRL